MGTLATIFTFYTLHDRGLVTCKERLTPAAKALLPARPSLFQLRSTSSKGLKLASAWPSMAALLLPRPHRLARSTWRPTTDCAYIPGHVPRKCFGLCVFDLLCDLLCTHAHVCMHVREEGQAHIEGLEWEMGSKQARHFNVHDHAQDLWLRLGTWGSEQTIASGSDAQDAKRLLCVWHEHMQHVQPTFPAWTTSPTGGMGPGGMGPVWDRYGTGGMGHTAMCAPYQSRRWLVRATYIVELHACQGCMRARATMCAKMHDMSASLFAPASPFA